jgi:hypothetical protein
MHLKILFFSFAIAVSFQTQDASMQQQRPPNIADIHTSMEISQKTTLSQAFVLALSNSGMAGGVVNKEGCDSPVKEFYIPQGMKLSQALDQLMATDNQHRWLIIAGGITLLPKDGVSLLLQAKIHDLQITDTNNLTFSVYQLMHTKAISDMISTLRLTLLSPEPGFSQALLPGQPKPEPHPLSLHDVSLLDALNMIAVQHGGAIWSYGEFDCAGKKQLRVDFISR